MILLKISKKENDVYYLQDESQKRYELELTFMDNKNAEIGDKLMIHKELLNPRYEGYLPYYTFGDLDNIYGKSNISLDDIDVIKIIKKDNKTFLMKRLYG